MEWILLFLLLCSCFCTEWSGSNEYVVVFHKNTTLSFRDEHVSQLKEKFENTRSGERIIHVYHIGNFIGYAATLSPSTLEAERRNPHVQYIEASIEMEPLFPGMEPSELIQSGAPWGLDRIDQHLLPLDGLYHYSASGGSNVDVFVIDTGIYLEHLEFEGRAIFGINTLDTNNEDCAGHGTAVASLVGGKTFGVAKKVTLVAVKVLGCGSTPTYPVIAGIDYVTKRHSETNRPSIAVLALTFAKTQSIIDAVTNSIAAGVTYVTAAGNQNTDACNSTPAGIQEVLTVASSLKNDSRAYYSNWGPCVDIFAPGESITCAYIGGINRTNTFNGTQWPAAYTAGAAAIYLGEHPTAKPAEVISWLTSVATPGVIQNPTDTPNLLLYSPYA